MTNNTHKRVLRSFLIVFFVLVIASLANWLSVHAPLRGQTTVFVEVPPFANDNRAMAEYFSYLFIEYAKDSLLLEDVVADMGIGLGKDEIPSIEVKSSHHGQTAFELAVIGLSQSNIIPVLEDLIGKIETRLLKEARKNLEKLINEKEKELNILERKALFESSLGRKAKHFRRRCEELGAELQKLRHLFGQPFGLLHTTEPIVFTKMDEGWSSHDVIGLLTGLALMLVLGEFFLHGVNRKRAQSVIEKHSDLPVIGTIPHLLHLLPVKKKPMSGEADAFRGLRSELLCRRAKRIVFVSWSQGEGTTTCVANTALAFAENGNNVLLVDGNLRRPAIHSTFKVSNDVGLSDVLIDTEAKEVLWDAPDASLKLITAGPRPPDPSALLAGRRLDVFINALDDLASDIVIVDVPPMAVCSDVLFFAKVADAVIFVTSPGAEPPERIVGAIKQLQRQGIPLAGLVMNDIDEAKATRTTYAHQYS